MNTKSTSENLKSKPKDSTELKAEPKPEKTQPESKTEKEIVQKLEEEVAHWKDLSLRTAAEMENLKKRTQIDIEKANRYATSSFAKDLLPIADCLEHAIDCATKELKKEKNPLIENLLKGIEMTATNLTTALKKQQIEKVPGIGHVFDPNLHKVIQEVEDKTKPAGTIIQELQSGYTIGGDRTLREAIVVVSKS